MGTTALGGAVTAQKIVASPLAADVEAANGILASISVPGDATILDVILTVTDMDSSTGLLIDVGDVSGPGTPDDNRFIAAFTGQAAGTLHANVAGGLLDASFTYANDGTIESVIEATVNTVATTGVDGTLTLEVVYYR